MNEQNYARTRFNPFARSLETIISEPPHALKNLGQGVGTSGPLDA